MRRVRAGLLLAMAGLVLAGCGDPDLWARYRAERGFWRARRLIDRVQLNPGAATAADYAPAAAAFRAVTAGFPAAEWASPGRSRAPLARDVATIVGRAAIALARVDEMQGRLDAALAGYVRAQADFAAMRPVALEAALARAAAFERAGRDSAATEVYAEIAGQFPMIDPESGASILPVMDAPLRVARDQARAGRVAAADSTLWGAERRFTSELGHQRGRAPAPDLWVRLAKARMARGRTEGALEALRGALSEPVSGADAAEMVLTLAEYCVEGGRPDSAFAYTDWAERAFGDPIRAQSMVLAARAWERRGSPDSAVAAWGRFLDAYPGAVSAGSVARFQRGRLLEQLGRWEQARSEYRTLMVLNPTHELAFDALRRMVGWHASHGEKELARIEGRRGLEALDRLIVTHRDERVLQLARLTRADLLVAIEDWVPACGALAEVWDRYGDSPLGARAGLLAADLAERRLHDTARAAQLYRDLAERARGDAERLQARDALGRLARGRG
jgi:tetratricopeptide (TPR) repeat protein